MRSPRPPTRSYRCYACPPRGSPVAGEAGDDSFFFSSRRRHTRYIGDWSSDVCSSDLMLARLRASQRHGMELRTNAMVVAQVWRDRHGRQVNLARLLQAVDVRAVSQRDGREAGVLQATAGTSDAIDATVVLLASAGDRILTSDPDDIARLA